MAAFPERLHRKLQEREKSNALRQLSQQTELIDFSSNDYLGFAKKTEIFEEAHHFLSRKDIKVNGATGSRLLSGNHELYTQVEKQLCEYHNAQSALIFNSGYDANIGFFSSAPQRNDVVLYDEWIHASIRDGISMSLANSHKFAHNDLEDLSNKIERVKEKDPTITIYVVTESVFSMDGDTPNLKALVTLCETSDAHLIIDEAHAVGIFSTGLLQQLGLHEKVFARIITFGKALGCHGAAVLGSEKLKQYLVNFARSFMYTTGLPPHSIATIKAAYEYLSASTEEIKRIKDNIEFFGLQLIENQLDKHFVKSESAIHCCILPGNDKVKEASARLREKGFDVRPILSPTVPAGQERLRFCLHAYNSKEEIAQVLNLLATFV